MKIFFISDIHGNQYALESILRFARNHAADLIFCLGDITGYFTGVNEVIQLLRAYNVQTILGNHDAYLLGKLPIGIDAPYYSAFRKTKEIISTDSLAWLRDMNYSSKHQLSGLEIQLYHGGPENLFSQSIYPDKLPQIQHLFSSSDIYMFGHSHLQFGVKIGKKCFVNPGSVGLPRNGDIRAHGVSFDLGTSIWEEHRVPYDVPALLTSADADNDVNRKFFNNVQVGRSSKKILKLINKPILDDAMKDKINRLNLTVSETPYGSIIYDRSNVSTSGLIYIANYGNGSIELTSSNFQFNWQGNTDIEGFSGFDRQFISQDLSGIYYKKDFGERDLLNKSIFFDIEHIRSLFKERDLRNLKI